MLSPSELVSSPTSRSKKLLQTSQTICSSDFGALKQFVPPLPAAARKEEHAVSGAGSSWSPARKETKPAEPAAMSTLQLSSKFRLHSSKSHPSPAMPPKEHSNYFRPRPRLDSGWFQMPKPPQLAYQREQFFAQLLRKPQTAPARTVRRKGPTRKKAAKPGTNMEKATLKGESMNPLRRLGKVVSSPEPLDELPCSRMDCGFAGGKMTGGAQCRPGTSMEGFTRPRLQVLQPDIDRPATAGPPRRVSTSLTSTVPKGPSVISLRAVDPEQQLPQHKQKQQYIEMRIMGDIHKRELATMKRELLEVRQAIEAAQLTSAMKDELVRVASLSAAELEQLAPGAAADFELLASAAPPTEEAAAVFEGLVEPES